MNTAKAVAGKVKIVNVAYGVHNVAGESIPADPIVRPILTIPESKQLRVIAWNLNGMRSFLEKRGERLKKLWDHEKVDILGITEHKITDDVRAAEMEAEVRKLINGDIHFVWNKCTGKKGYSGSLAIVRGDVFKQCKKITFGTDQKSDPEGRLITLEFDKVAVLIAYVPNSGMDLNRLNYRTTTWDKDLSDLCVALSKRMANGVIIAGDLNVAHRDMDIWNVDAAHIPKLAGTTPQERSSFEKRFLNQGFVDTFAHIHPDKRGWFSYWSIKAKNKPKNRGLRLDYVLADAKVKILDAFIACQYTVDGDHCPVGVIAEMDKSHL